MSEPTTPTSATTAEAALDANDELTVSPEAELTSNPVLPEGTELHTQKHSASIVPEEEAPPALEPAPPEETPTIPETAPANVAPTANPDVVAAHVASQVPDVTPANELPAQGPVVPLV